MSAMSDFLEAALLNQLFRGTAYTAPGTGYVGLYTAVPNDTGGGTEVTGGGYARAPVTCNGTSWTAPGAAGTIGNANILVLGTATADWGTVVGAGYWNAVTAGTMLMWGTLTATKIVASADVFQFDAGALGISFA